VCTLILCAGCAGSREAGITQFSTIDALLAGVYDGEFSCAQVARHGSLGLGTFDRLDGEMVVVDGVVYQARADGTVRRVPGSLRTPFATVARFQSNRCGRTGSAMSLAALEHALDRLCPNPNAIYAIRIRAEFSDMKTRSVTAQKKPYRELVKVVKDQSVFELGAVRGTVVGFRFPAYFKGINAPGYHLHFLAQDRRSGGHILDLKLPAGAMIETSDCRRFEMLLPGSQGGFARVALDRDRSNELQKVER
jgi:acetolactate decarboxylase